ncbi:MAG: acetylornithine/N-succinyldiaminopimelate aminotransferase [Cyclobacteriaceae bacterium]|jgi:acetylornithine/N-succinyldiaminopimelate aminotransferase
MDPYEVYSRYDVTVVSGLDVYVYDDEGRRYLDFYGGHAVISIGHSHPHYIRRLTNQLSKLGFYSNSVKMPLQEELSQKLGQLSGYEDYSLFLCNSGAESNENAFKLASFHTSRSRIIVFENGFHGRTSLAVAATDSAKLIAPINATSNIIRLPFGDMESVEKNLDESVAAICIEGIQGIAGIYEPEPEFLAALSAACKKNGSLLILDEIQSGYGRTGRFFAHQYSPHCHPDIITVAKGMGNGFPIGGVLIHPSIKPVLGRLGTTFGGNHLACAAGLSVLEVIENEQLLPHTAVVGDYLLTQLKQVSGIKEIRGKGLMIGISVDQPAAEIRKKLLFEHSIFTGSASDPHTVRLLPPLTATRKHADHLVSSLKQVLTHE